MFEKTSRVELDDGRTLVVEYQGDGWGWDCYIAGGSKRPTFAESPAEAIVEHLGLAGERTPAWLLELSKRRQRELREAPRYACPCCGYLTLLNPGRCEICVVCPIPAAARTTSVSTGAAPTSLVSAPRRRGARRTRGRRGRRSILRLKTEVRRRCAVPVPVCPARYGNQLMLHHRYAPYTNA